MTANKMLTVGVDLNIIHIIHSLPSCNVSVCVCFVDLPFTDYDLYHHVILVTMLVHNV